MNEHERGILVGRLHALRDQVDALIDLAEGEEPQLACPHPPAQRQYEGDTMGNSSFTCKACGAHVTVASSSPDQILDRFVRRDPEPEGA